MKEILDKIYRILKWNLIQEERESQMELWLLAGKYHQIFKKGELKKFEKRRERKINELNACLPYIGDIIHEKEKNEKKNI